MRFILSFILFGLLFYGIWLFFPDAFATLVSWAAAVFNALISVYESIVGRNTTP